MGVEKERFAVSKFKDICMAVLRRVKRSGRPVGEEGWMGLMRERGRIVGDILAPTSDPED